jgi:hypothetical protein
LAKFWDSFPKAERRIRLDAQQSTRRELQQVVEKQLETHEFPALGQTGLLAQLKGACRELMAVDPDGWASTAHDRLSTLRQLNDGYLGARLKYLNLIDIGAENVASYFNDPGRNLEVQNAVADRIKQQAIQPSFAFLEETRHSLDDVKRRIRTIEF